MKDINNKRKYNSELGNKINTTGNYIHFKRKSLRYSRKKLSDKLMLLGIDISSQSIYDIEIGKRTVLDYELCAIAKVLETPTEAFLKEFKVYLDSI